LVSMTHFYVDDAKADLRKSSIRASDFIEDGGYKGNYELIQGRNDVLFSENSFFQTEDKYLDARSDYFELEDSFDHLFSEYDQAKDDLKELKSKKRRVEGELSDLQKDLDDLEDSLKSAKQQQPKLEAEVRQTKREMTSIYSSEASYNQAVRELRNASSRSENLKQEFVTAQAAHSKKVEQLNNDPNIAKIEGLKKHVAAIDQIIENKKSALQKLNDQKRDVAGRLAALRKKPKKTPAEVKEQARLAKQLEDINNQIENAKDDIVQQNAKKKKALDEIAILERDSN
ncbi:MAG: hypothetical protein KDD40_06790, partial [Bdellovibrionales bacterium]|nr:hypothetical protein [Bdellovibrionales bacterium]